MWKVFLIAIIAASLMFAGPAWGQASTGVLVLSITDSAGLGLKSTVEVVSEANQYKQEFATDAGGNLFIHDLHFGVYQILAKGTGFSSASATLNIRSEIPVRYRIELKIAPVSASVTVDIENTLLDPYRPSSVMQIGREQIRDRVASLPGRSVQDLVNTQPGWLYEGNAVLHPRGSEYQTQFVVDGIPLTDNRSPSFGPEIDANDLESINIYTAGIPAEYGRKMGGVVELNTQRNALAGLHGQLILSGGSYQTAESFGQVQDVWGKNALTVTASGSMTNHYLNPVVPENYTNHGATGDFSLRYAREVAQSDHFALSVRHELSQFEIPNELVQQQAGQLQRGDNSETMVAVDYQHLLSVNVLGNLDGMVRSKENGLSSNPLSTPILAFQDNHFREGYVKGAISVHRERQEWKAGFETDNTFLHENFHYDITDPSQFDEDTPGKLDFVQSRPDLEQAAFVEDLIRLGNWTVSAGLRWDHYQLLLNEHAFSPRWSVAYYLLAPKVVLHFSYDRIFQTPSNENILISSSSAISQLSANVLHLPVKPSRGNYYEGGMEKAFGDRLRFDANVFRRDFRNYADDDQLLNTGVSYPISFDKAVLYGLEGKLELVHVGKLSGFASYSYIVGNVWFPVTGGLFLGDDVDQVLSGVGHFPDSQDQRNTIRTRFEYKVSSHLSVASGLSSGSGLPFEYGGTEAEALAQYGPEVVDRLNFERGRVKPSLAVNASLMLVVYHSERADIRFQADGENLNNRLNVIDFGGLFSGNAIGPGRSAYFRLNASF
ncbi:hypothetical protein GCM10011507_02710 [Edaphobacter acidisoli]|uniref:TonB-dependent receptor n=2 Tax=Edaphobacter acidisoli TaxID=2040573 RepID=A0A916RIJ6_9BACT|nr:hypothetical protein GCM10011507_02710 [Edaphobacter acidisoli]